MFVGMINVLPFVEAFAFGFLKLMKDLEPDARMGLPCDIEVLDGFIVQVISFEFHINSWQDMAATSLFEVPKYSMYQHGP